MLLAIARSASVQNSRAYDSSLFNILLPLQRFLVTNIHFSESNMKQSDRAQSNERDSMKTSPIIFALALIVTIAIPVAVHGKSTSPTFVNMPLIRPDGGSEPELSIGTDGTTVFVSLSWTQFATNAWKASFGQTPVFQGQIDTSLAPGVGGGEDADVDIGSTGTLHATTLSPSSTRKPRLPSLEYRPSAAPTQTSPTILPIAPHKSLTRPKLIGRGSHLTESTSTFPT